MDQENDDLSRTLEIARAEMAFRASRSSGPGGQHAQKNETRIEAYLELASSSLAEEVKEKLRARFGATVRAVAQDERSQLMNRELASERLLAKIRLALTSAPPRTPTKPSRGSVLERLALKRRHSLLKRARRKPGEDE